MNSCMITFYLTWIALIVGAAAAAAALYGHYRVLPAWLTGPEVCLMEDGGCAVLFRSPRSRLLGVPNALLGVLLYALLAIGLLLALAAVAAVRDDAPRRRDERVPGLQPALARPAVPDLLDRPCRECRARAGCCSCARRVCSTSPSASWRRRADPDALYRQRENIASAQQAEGIWAERLAKDPKDFESAWKLARARYWLGGHADEKERKAYLEAGIAAGRAAAAIAPNKPEGHFWIAANMGALAESFGLRQGLKYRGDIKDALETVLRLDPAFQQGSADRALGRWYFKVPGLFGGSDRKSEEHLRKSLTYNPNSSASLFFLAETLIDLGKKDEARDGPAATRRRPVDPDWAPEDREFKTKGAKLLADLR